MKQKISELLLAEHIDCFGFLPLSACSVQKSYLLEKNEIRDGTVILFAMPYYTHQCDGDKNISAYAVAKDYHLYFKNLTSKLLTVLSEQFSHHRFAAFADHSPIDERMAAAAAGLGILGRHGLLITEKYSSYVFIGEIITDAIMDCQIYKPTYCENCGACLMACPMAKKETDVCLSALTQKKGTLSETEKALILKYGSVWGCDICQQVCPHTQKALKSHSIETPIPFFNEQSIPCLSSGIVEEMSDETFSERAYSWRGRETIIRNLKLAEEQAEQGGLGC
jgi:epoxyqueuosine reductase